MPILEVTYMTDWEEREFQFYDWEKQYGREEAILVASEEWGLSTYVVKEKVEFWENQLWQ